MDEADKDMFSAVEEVFCETYGIVEERTASLKDCFVLYLCLNNSKDGLISMFSDGSCSVFDATTLVSRLSGHALHDKMITGLVSDRHDPNLFYTCSEDATVKTWDVRQGLAREATQFAKRHDGGNSAGSKGPLKPLTCLDATPGGRLLCAGTEKVLRDTFLLFWDSRSRELLGGYWDSHEDDITSVRFHPTDSARLASGGVDGIVNVFDVSQDSEEDAIISSANTESSVQRLCWVGEKGLVCITHTEELNLWGDFEADTAPSKVFNRDDVCASIRRSNSHCAYLVDCNDRGNGDLVVLAGSSCETNPCQRLARVRKYRLKPLADLKTRKKSDALTRCSVFEGKIVYTGGEDGVVRMWKEGHQEDQTMTEKTGKVKSKKKVAGGCPY